MPKKRKTKEEKIKSGYRLENFKLNAEVREVRKEVEEFGYLDKNYVRRDLTRTIIFSLVIVGLLLAAKLYLG
jgi:hypothetical protein